MTEIKQGDTESGLVRQHLIDPESCMRCDSCRIACPSQAISMQMGTFVVDFALCDSKGACLVPCETGAISHWRLVPRDAVYTRDQQAAWEVLPPQAQLAGMDRFAGQPVEPAAGHGPPPSAPRPVINRYSLRSPAQVPVAENIRLTPPDASSDIHHIVFDLSAVDFPVLEGQSVGVLPPGRDALGAPHMHRLYSVANARDGEGGRRGHMTFTVKRVTEDPAGNPHHGVCSNYLCDLKPGETVRLVGPYGNSFLMPDDPDTRLLMICTGTGIAPMRGIIERRRLTGTATPHGLMLVYGGRTPADLPYHDALVALHGTGIDLELSLSREPGRPRRYVQDALQARGADVTAFLSDPRGYVYLCGLRGMEDGVMQTFAALCAASGRDWPATLEAMKAGGRLHIETY